MQHLVGQGERETRQRSYLILLFDSTVDAILRRLPLSGRGTLMAEMVSSLVVGQVMDKTLSFLVGQHEEKSNTRDSVERLEMAHIKMEAALEISNRWQITDVSLLRWQKKLKRAADECDSMMHKWKRKALEDKEIKDELAQSSFSKRITHATISFISSFVRQENDEPHSSVIKRFERFADGAGEFLRFTELGGTPWKYMFFDPLIGHLLAGKELFYEILQGSQHCYFCVRPLSFANRGLEASLCFDYEDVNAPEKNSFLGLLIRLSESINIIEITIKCLQSVTSHFKSTAETIIKELTQLPTQDFSFVPYIVSSDIEHWNYHNTFTQWFRSNPRCCKECEHTTCSSNTNVLELSCMFPEPVIDVFLQCHISPLEYNWERSTIEDEENVSKDLPHLKLGVFFIPHDSPKNLQATAESSMIEVIDGQKQRSMHTNVSLHQVDEMLLPKVINIFYHKTKVIKYQMFWKSKHGSIHLSVEKAIIKITSARKTIQKVGNDQLFQENSQRMARKKWWKQIAMDVLKLWVECTPCDMRDLVLSWIKRVDKM